MSTTEKLYAKLLEPQGHGYPIYTPTSHIKVGDVGSLVGKDFARRFNAFELTREEARKYQVPLFRTDRSPMVAMPERYDIFIATENVILKRTEFEAGADAAGMGGFRIHIDRKVESKAAAICIPTHPVSISRALYMHSLQEWWDDWQHNVVLNTRSLNNPEPLFLVMSITTTPQFAICCSKSSSKSTELRVYGSSPLPVGPAIQIAAGAGTKIMEATQSFGFQIGEYNPDNPWVILVNRRSVSMFGPLKRFRALFSTLFHRLGKRHPNKIRKIGYVPSMESGGDVEAREPVNESRTESVVIDEERRNHLPNPSNVNERRTMRNRFGADFPPNTDDPRGKQMPDARNDDGDDGDDEDTQFYEAAMDDTENIESDTDQIQNPNDESVSDDSHGGSSNREEDDVTSGTLDGAECVPLSMGDDPSWYILKSQKAGIYMEYRGGDLDNTKEAQPYEDFLWSHVGELVAITLRETAHDKTSLFDERRGSKTTRGPDEIQIPDPLEPEALLSLGDKYMALDDIDSAVQAYNRAVELNPGHEESWALLAEAFKVQKAWHKIVASYERAVRSRANRAKSWPWTHLGDSYKAIHEIEKALDAYKIALHNHEQESLAWTALRGTQKTKWGDIVTVVRNTDGTRSDRRFPPESNERFIAAAEATENLQGNVFQTSQSHLGREHPDTLASMNDLAVTFWVQGGQSKLGQAVAWHEEILTTRERIHRRLDPRRLISMHNLAAAYWSVGRTDKALIVQEDVVHAANELWEGDRNTRDIINQVSSIYRSALDIQRLKSTPPPPPPRTPPPAYDGPPISRPPIRPEPGITASNNNPLQQQESSSPHPQVVLSSLSDSTGTLLLAEHPLLFPSIVVIFGLIIIWFFNY